MPKLGDRFSHSGHTHTCDRRTRTQDGTCYLWAEGKRYPLDECKPVEQLEQSAEYFVVAGKVLKSDRTTGLSDGSVCHWHQGKKYLPEQYSIPCVVTHIRKPGWKGYIYQASWNLEGFVDVIWVESPWNEKLDDYENIPTMPVRYPVKALVFEDFR